MLVASYLSLAAFILPALASPLPSNNTRRDPAPVNYQSPLPFITRSGTTLMSGSIPFRFCSMNVPNLHLLEDRDGGKTTPTDFEQSDALLSLAQMGGEVTRIYPFQYLDYDSGETAGHFAKFKPGKAPAGWTALGTDNLYANEQFFTAMDNMLYRARMYKIRVIIPFIDTYDYWGGVPAFADYYGLDPDHFWTDPSVRVGFKAIINYVLNRVNSITKMAYKNDAMIALWETGNELSLYGSRKPIPGAWTVDIATYIKSIDKNHLVADGSYASLAGFSVEALQSPMVDVFQGHYYQDNHPTISSAQPAWPNDISYASRAANDAAFVASFDKPYYVGEYALAPIDEMTALLEVVESNPLLSGSLIWSLRYHARDGGFYSHSEDGGYYAYHHPGFAYESGKKGFPKDEVKAMAMIRKFAAALGSPTPYMTAPPAPAPSLIAGKSSRNGGLVWTGSAGAQYYQVQRSTSGPGNYAWKTISGNVMDNVGYGSVIFKDQDGGDGSAWYRVTAFNDFGSVTSTVQVLN
ncbi:hypothetical protein HK101_007155 [Irineochytrium annulatum]|nr:hypothetical protein HK101_007155 [Irineochytrium annulatum]